MALVLFLRSSVTVPWPGYIRQKTCGITNGDDGAAAWKVRTLGIKVHLPHWTEEESKVYRGEKKGTSNF